MALGYGGILAWSAIALLAGGAILYPPARVVLAWSMVLVGTFGLLVGMAVMVMEGFATARARRETSEPLKP